MTLGKPADLERIAGDWRRDLRLVLLAGPDLSAARLQATRVAARLAGGEPIVDLVPADLESEPGRLADAAASIPLFAAVQVVRIEATSALLLPAIRELLQAPAAGNPVIATTTGQLRKTDALYRLAADHPAVLLVIFYPPEVGDLVRFVVAEGRAGGLRIPKDVAAALVARAGTDQGVLAREVEKLALYRNAGPDHPQTLAPEDVDALVAGGGEEEQARLIMALIAGNAPRFEAELRLAGRGSAIPTLRGLARRLFQLLEPARAHAGGTPASAALGRARPPIFWRERESLEAALADWPPGRIEAALETCLAAEAAIKTAGGQGDILAWQALAGLAAGGGFPAARALR